MFKYVGKTIDVKYDSGLHYTIEYVDEKTLKWTALADGVAGADESGTETFYCFEAADDVFAFDWIEEEGISVSQVINFGTLEVYSFIAWNNPASRGGREFSINTGKIAFL